MIRSRPAVPCPKVNRGVSIGRHGAPTLADPASARVREGTGSRVQGEDGESRAGEDEESGAGEDGEDAGGPGLRRR
ncbi:hypothetical protein JCM12681A_19480 [Streptomyces mexicanus]